jgi:glutamyl-tRNA synthetase
MDAPPRGRFAPTPSGALHVGSARTAVASALAVWSAGGRFLLRVEDLDAARAAPGATAAMLADLRWIGLDWDEGPDVGGPAGPYAQRDRAPLYQATLAWLRDRGLVYPCACSRRDLEQAAQAPHGAEPVYPGTCRDDDPAAVLARARALGRGVSWRFRTDPDAPPVIVRDRVSAPITQQVHRDVGDFVVMRADGVAAYQLAVVVDDLAMGVTEVVRGDDLLASTPRQVALYEGLGGRAPRWAHLPLVLGGDGARLAKRSGSMGIAALRERGVPAAWLRGWLLESLGARDQGTLRASAGGFDVGAVDPSPVVWRAPAAGASSSSS